MRAFLHTGFSQAQNTKKLRIAFYYHSQSVSGTDTKHKNVAPYVLVCVIFYYHNQSVYQGHDFEQTQNTKI